VHFLGFSIPAVHAADESLLLSGPEQVGESCRDDPKRKIQDRPIFSG
jgi:hypothetical protein